MNTIIKYRMIPVVAMLIALQFAYILHSEGNKRAGEVAKARTEMMLEDTSDDLESLFSNEFFILEYMASDWERTGGVDKEIWFANAHKIVEHYRFQAVSWIEGTHVRWIVPLVGNEKAVDLDLSFEESRRVAIARSTETGEVSIGGPMSLVQGGTGLLLFAPIFDGDERVGFINGVIKTEPHFSSVLKRKEGCGIAVRSNGETLYQSGETEGGLKKEVMVSGFQFEVQIYCEPESNGQSQIYWIITCILVGILTEMAMNLIAFRDRQKKVEEDIADILKK